MSGLTNLLAPTFLATMKGQVNVPRYSTLTHSIRLGARAAELDTLYRSRRMATLNPRLYPAATLLPTCSGKNGGQCLVILGPAGEGRGTMSSETRRSASASFSNRAAAAGSFRSSSSATPSHAARSCIK